MVLGKFSCLFSSLVLNAFGLSSFLRICLAHLFEHIWEFEAIRILILSYFLCYRRTSSLKYKCGLSKETRVLCSLHSSQLVMQRNPIPPHDLLRDSNAETSNRIGRITEGLLLGVAETVDIVEPIAKFSDNLKGKEGVGQIFNVGLEDWSPMQSEDPQYDLIWNQWCVGHLTDAQLVVYLEKCGKALKDGGLVVVKENLSTSGEDVFDELDSSVTRYLTTPEETLSPDY